MFLILLFLSLGYSANILPNGGNGFFHLSRFQGASEFCQLLPTGEVPVKVLNNNKLTLNVNQGSFQGEISGDYNDNIFTASRNVTAPPPCSVVSVSFTVNTTSLTQGFGKISAHCLGVTVSCDFEVAISGFSASSPTASPPPPTTTPSFAPIDSSPTNPPTTLVPPTLAPPTLAPTSSIYLFLMSHNFNDIVIFCNIIVLFS
jgi:hypothetical protein